MTHALIAKNKIGFIEGTISATLETKQPTKYAIWNQCNSMILSWLTHSVEADLAKGIIHAKSAHQVWQDLKDQFSQKYTPTIFHIQKFIATITQGTMFVYANAVGKLTKALNYCVFLLPNGSIL